MLGLTKHPNGTQHTLEDYGTVQWELALCLLAAWVLILLVLIKGIQSYGKAAYAITLSPYFVLTALLIYTLQLDGAIDGIEYYLKPDWNELAKITVWQRAASQILFSLSVGFGSQIILSSYNKVTNNTFRDAILISVFNSLTSIYAGFVVFSIVGFLSVQTQKDVEDVITDGIKLAFVSYPSAVLEMDVSPLWSFLFFFMLLNLALSSSCGGVQNFVAFIIDEWPALAPHRLKVLVACCASFFLCGLSMCTNGGLYLFNIFDTRLTASLLFITVSEIVLVSWIYGMNRFLNDLAEMGMDFRSGFGLYIGIFWKAMFMVITPGVLSFLTIMAWVEYEPTELNGYEYPAGWQVFGWFVELTPLAIALAYPVYAVIRARQDPSPYGNWMKKVRSPTQSWYDTPRDAAIPVRIKERPRRASEQRYRN